MKKKNINRKAVKTLAISSETHNSLRDIKIKIFKTKHIELTSYDKVIEYLIKTAHI